MTDFAFATDASQVLGIDDLVFEDVIVPEWKLRVLVRGLTGAERDEFEASIVRGYGSKRSIDLANARARFVSMCIVHPETHRRLFSPAQVDALGRKSTVALQRVYEVGMRLSGLTEEVIDDLGKVSESDQSEDSTSD